MIQFLALLAVHWVGDFVLQTHWQASNKSKNIEAMARHIGTYAAVLSVAAPVIFGIEHPDLLLAFVVCNVGLHLATDVTTSDISARLWAKQDWHNFFVVIGLDQLIHQATLGATMLMAFGVQK